MLVTVVKPACEIALARLAVRAEAVAVAKAEGDA